MSETGAQVRVASERGQVDSAPSRRLGAQPSGIRRSTTRDPTDPGEAEILDQRGALNGRLPVWSAGPCGEVESEAADRGARDPAGLRPRKPLEARGLSRPVSHLTSGQNAAGEFGSEKRIR